MAGIKLENRKATSIAYINHVGPFDKIPWPENIERLYSWAKSQHVMPGFYPMGIYLDDPKNTPVEKCRTEVAITFKGEAKEESGIRIRQQPEMKVATYSHKGPSSEFAKTYDDLAKWIDSKGLRPTGPPIEVYSKRPEIVDGETILYAKIMMPVEKK